MLYTRRAKYRKFCTRVGETELWPEETRHVYYNTEDRGSPVVRQVSRQDSPPETYGAYMQHLVRLVFSSIVAANCKNRRAIAYRIRVIARGCTRFRRLPSDKPWLSTRQRAKVAKVEWARKEKLNRRDRSP